MAVHKTRAWLTLAHRHYACDPCQVGHGFLAVAACGGGGGGAEELADLGPGEFVVAGVADGLGQELFGLAMRLARACRWTAESPSQ
jgi:hypothetical protein